MAYNTPILNSVTLPNPTDYREQRAFRGGMASMADGTVAFDVVNLAAKKLYTLGWKELTSEDKAIIESTYDAMMTATVDFTPIEGSATSVTRTENEPSFDVVNTALGLRWNVNLELREV